MATPENTPDDASNGNDGMHHDSSSKGVAPDVHMTSNDDVTYTEAQVKTIRWKIDIYVMPLMTLIYLFAYIDRSNIGNARLAGLEKDLHLNGNDFNAALSIFYVSYIVFQIPCVTLCKWVGPGWFIPAITLAFGVCSIGTAFTNDYSTLCGVRFLLGIFESAMQPALAYYLSRWYTRSELTFRVSLYIVSASLAGAFGGLLASAILTLDHFGSLQKWRMIFAIEGIATAALGFVCFFILTDRPQTALWLTEEEKKIAILRVQRERLGATEVLDKFNWKKAKLGIFNPVVIPTSIIFFFNSITVHGASFFLPTIVKTIFPHKTVQEQQLLSVPPYILGSISCLATCYASWKLDRRGIFMILGAPIVVVGYAIFVATENSTVRYVAIFLPFFGIFAYGAITPSHCSANVVSDTARSSAIGYNAMMGSMGGLLSTWLFLDFDAPRYLIANSLNLAVQAAMIVLATGLYFWIERSNKKRDQVDETQALGGLTPEEIQELEWKNPSFRWVN